MTCPTEPNREGWEADDGGDLDETQDQIEGELPIYFDPGWEPFMKKIAAAIWATEQESVAERSCVSDSQVDGGE